MTLSQKEVKCRKTIFRNNSPFCVLKLWKMIYYYLND